MSNDYIRDYQVKLLENTYDGTMEQLKAITYGLEYILNDMENSLNTNEDIKQYNTLTTCLLSLKEIVKERDESETLPF